MKLLQFILYEDLQKYSYFFDERKKRWYQKIKILLACLPFVMLPMVFLKRQPELLLLILFMAFFLYKCPFLYIRMCHIQNCNHIIGAIPLWMNQMYALIEKNTIHNAIINSSNEHTPKAIQKDLQQFIQRIQQTPDDRDAYLSFLANYQIEGFFDIMLKLYEFRNLSKEKLKYEIRSLNAGLSKIETWKRQIQFKNEMFLGDTCTCFLIFIPCIYMSVISMMPSLFQI